MAVEPQIIIISVEVLLVLLTTTLLLSPLSIPTLTPTQGRWVSLCLGMFFLSVTFCWSVVLGIILKVN